MELIKQIDDLEQWVLVFDGDFVEGSMVNAQPLGAILLRDKNDRGSPQ
jgi:hypothetical protein